MILIKAVLVVVVASLVSSADNEVKPFPGKPISIWSLGSGNLKLNTPELDSIFGHVDLVDRKIAVYGIDGIDNDGKNIMADYFLKYMYKNFKSIASPLAAFNHDHKTWFGSSDEQLKGFTTIKSDNGINMWSDVFLHETDKGEKIAIVIVCTHGVIDPKWTDNDNSMFFMLSSISTSIQFLNLKDSIEDHLNLLDTVAAYGKYVSEKGAMDKPFSSLNVLLRDWTQTDQYKFGFEDGQKLVDAALTVKDGQTEARTDLIKNIIASYDKTSAFLMPKLGDAEFVKQLKDFVAELFDDSFSTKEIQGENLNVSKYYNYLKKYAETFKNNDLRSVAAIYETKL